MKLNLKEYLTEKTALINKTIVELLPGENVYPAVIHEAMQYSLFAGGKRLRPILCLASAEAIGADSSPLLPAACSLEMIHTYSLIHDDLPAMDDDDYRRGKPTNHKVFGEAIAVLAGDALLTQAFENLAVFGKEYAKKDVMLQVIAEIAQAAGTLGMIGGQVVDIQSEGKKCDQETLLYIHSHKTGALFRASLRTGALLSQASPDKLAAVTDYAEKFGLAFQITDDILDEIGDGNKLGKPVGSDLKNEKVTYPLLYGLEKSKILARQAVDQAVASLEYLPGDTQPLVLLARYLLERES